MPTERIDDEDFPERPCLNPDHDPPKYMVFKPGRYKHTCPACGHVQYFTVPAIVSKIWQGGKDLRVRWASR